MRDGLVPRDRLVSAIHALADAKLVLVRAPAGSGKTTLLGEWRSSSAEERPFAWLSLDPADNDPVRLIEGVLRALRAVQPGFGEHALTQLAGPAALTEVVVPSLLNELAELPVAVVVVLDDYHVIRNARVHEAIAFLLERLPGNVQLALATRSEPPLPLGRLRVRRQMVELLADDLRFTPQEASALLGAALSVPLEPGDVARLQERTEGWAAGLQLAALSLGARDDVHDFISSFAGDDRPVVDYLGFEVLDGQPDEVRDFLLRISVLERLNGPLCDAVSGLPGSAARLDQLERDGLFLVPLDTKRQWYRCHQLFGELLRSELRRAQPELIPRLHARAAGWYREHGFVSESIRHAIAAGDSGEASSLITDHWYAFLQRGRVETVAAWLDALGDQAVANDAALCLTKAWMGVNLGRLDDVGRWIDAAERATGETGTGPTVEAGIASLREIHCYMGGDTGRAVEAGRRSVESGHTPWRPIGCPVLGIALFWSGEGAEAARELQQSVQVARAGGNHLAVIHASAGLAAIRAEDGDLEQGESVAAEALALADDRGLAGHWATTMARVVHGRALEQRGRLAEAGAELDRAAELSRRGVAALEIGYALLTRADVLRLEDPRGAAALVAEARGVIAGCPDPGILQELLARIERRLHLAPRARRSLPAGDEELTERELAVLALLPGRMSQREIGQALYLSINTIKTHVRGIYRKLDVETRDDAVARARERGLV